jgi:flavin reductase (DIM6/NTAB) family NADH-FMN oxidoreductase RutF
MGKKNRLPKSYESLWPLPATTVLVSVSGGSRPPNIITIAACGIASAEPPLISLAIGIGQYSLKLIRDAKDFVVNVPSGDSAQIVDWCGRVSGKKVNKFEEGNLTAGKSIGVKSPIILECPVNYECKLWKIIDCGSHALVLGEVQDVQVDEGILGGSGQIDTSKFNPLVSFQLEYWNLGGKLGRWGELYQEKD